MNHAEIKRLVLGRLDPRINYLLLGNRGYSNRGAISQILTLAVKREGPFVLGLLAASCRFLQHKESPAMFLHHALVQLEICRTLFLLLWVAHE
jgi:hypothetical protein